MPPAAGRVRASIWKRISALLSKLRIEIHTGGGAVVGGNVNTGGGPFAGRDFITIGSLTIDTRHLAYALIVSTILVLAYLIFRPPPDGLPSPMKGDFNIAVAAFSQVDSSPGRFTRTNSLADEVYQALETQLKPLQESGIKFEVRGPSEIGAIQGATAIDRATNAATVAQDHGADMVIYGVLRLDSNQTSLQPELFVNPDKFFKAEEAAGQYGQYTFGLPITVAARIDRNSVASSELRQGLNERVVSLVDFSIGLGYFALIKYDDAAAYFEKASQSADSGKEQAVVLLFQGTAAVKRRDLDSAAAYYRAALAVDEQYARAQLGLSQIFFLRAKKDDCQPGQVDAAGLAAAEAGYQKARDMPYPSLADIDFKARLMLANVYICQSRADIENRWLDAESNLKWIIQFYESAPEDNARIQYLAAEAANTWALSYMLQGELAWKTGVIPEDVIPEEFSQAAELWDKARLLSQEPGRRAVYLVWQAWIHLLRSECKLAQADMESSQDQYQEFKQKNPAIENDEYLSLFESVEKQWEKQCVAAGG